MKRLKWEGQGEGWEGGDEEEIFSPWIHKRRWEGQGRWLRTWRGAGGEMCWPSQGLLAFLRGRGAKVSLPSNVEHPKGCPCRRATPPNPHQGHT